MAELQDNLPPGWDCKVDERTGKFYYVNHYTKSTTWDDPRNRHRHLAWTHDTPKHFQNVQTEYVPLQHGSPDLRRNYVYPSSPSPISAFQMPSAHMSPKSSHLQEMRPLVVRSPKIQETSLITEMDTEEAVMKISAMFPTVSETHIRLLLKNCRYMKSIFPQADETVILDVLQNNENNVQKTSEALKEMGFVKKNAVTLAQQKIEVKKEEDRKVEVEVKRQALEEEKAKVKSSDEKKKIKADLQEKYKDVQKHLITMALESVNFDEDRAKQILEIMIQEDNKAEAEKKKEEEIIVTDFVTKEIAPIPISQSRQSLKSLLKSEKSEKDKTSFSRVIEESDRIQNFGSTNLTNTKGPNSMYVKGPDEKLLLEDYCKWQGSNVSIKKGTQNLAKGPNKELLTGRKYQSCGPNAEFQKGPKFGLAKGSIFTQLKSVVVGESRGK